MKLQLRDYQTECLAAIFDASKASIFKQLVSLPTGTGKTIIFAYIVKSVAERGGLSLILVHRDELLNQAEEKLKTPCNQLSKPLIFLPEDLSYCDTLA